jgi:hypothetical protein
MNFLPLGGDMVVMIILLIIVGVIVTVLRQLFVLLPTIIAGGVIWFLTHNILLTIMGSLIVAALSFARRH